MPNEEDNGVVKYTLVDCRRGEQWLGEVLGGETTGYTCMTHASTQHNSIQYKERRGLGREGAAGLWRVPLKGCCWWGLPTHRSRGAVWKGRRRLLACQPRRQQY